MYQTKVGAINLLAGEGVVPKSAHEVETQQRSQDRHHHRRRPRGRLCDQHFGCRTPKRDRRGQGGWLEQQASRWLHTAWVPRYFAWRRFWCWHWGDCVKLEWITFIHSTWNTLLCKCHIVWNNLYFVYFSRSLMSFFNQCQLNVFIFYFAHNLFRG